MKLGKRLRWLLFALISVSGPAMPDAILLLRPDVQRYIDEQVGQGHFDRRSLNAIFSHIKLMPNILAILDRPSTSRPWYQFRRGFFNEPLLKSGVQFWKANRQPLARAERIYGVPAEVIVATLGVETQYGKNTGSYRVVDVLATIGFDYPRRAEFFRHELTELLMLSAEEQIDPMHLTGSYAGAMGLPQFLPSSYRKWAVDFDGSGRRDIWNSPEDAIGSIAYYLQQHGWLRGAGLLCPASVTPGPVIDALITHQFELQYTIRQLKMFGVIPDEAVADDSKAVLVALEAAPGITEYFLGLNNFIVITRYNKSVLYAKVLADIARELKLRFAAA